MSKYTVVALFGESGVGKSRLLDVLADARPQWHKIVGCTSRPMREGEKEGINYYYLTREDFEKKIVYGEMIECHIFRDWLYGTAYSCLQEGKVNIGVFNIAGIEDLMKNEDITVIPVRVVVPDKMRILRQLNREEHPDVYEICRRYVADTSDFADISFDYDRIDNSGPLVRTLRELEKLLGTIIDK